MEEKETGIDTQPKSLTRNQYKIILSQQSKSLCQIVTSTKKFTGFLCKIPNPVLITTNHFLNESQLKTGEPIKLIFTDENDKKIYKTIVIDDK